MRHSVSSIAPVCGGGGGTPSFPIGHEPAFEIRRLRSEVDSLHEQLQVCVSKAFLEVEFPSIAESTRARGYMHSGTCTQAAGA